MTPAQCRAAGALIDMTQAELTGHAVVSMSSITDYETGVGMPDLRDPDELQGVLEWAGVEFTDAKRPGVWLRKGE